MQENMPQRGFNYEHNDVQRFFPNRVNGCDEFNRKALRELRKKARDYRGKHANATSTKIKIKGQTVELQKGEVVLKGKVTTCK